MTDPAPTLVRPPTDPSPLVELCRGSYATELLTAAVAHLRLFSTLAAKPMTFEAIQKAIDLEARPANVLIVAMRAMGLIDATIDDQLDLSPLARQHLVPGGDFYMGDYVGLAAESPGVLAMVERLRTNRPAAAKESDPGAAYIFRAGTESAMDHDDSARRLTLALAGRAKNVAPALAQRVPMPAAKRLLDVGGGTGIYSIALLQANPSLRAIVWDRAPVLNVAREWAEHYGVTDRMEFLSGDMFSDPVPTDCDVMLLSNILHDWDVRRCRELIGRCASVLPSGGELLIHDVFLNDALDGPLPIALYSAALFSITEGRAYSGAEYAGWLTEAGLSPGPILPTLIHCGVIAGKKN